MVIVTALAVVVAAQKYHKVMNQRLRVRGQERQFAGKAEFSLPQYITIIMVVKFFETSFYRTFGTP